MATKAAIAGQGGRAAPAGRSRRARRPSLSSDQFLDKALDLFLENGFERTSIDAITASAGIAKRTVYQRYGDKQSLFRAAIERAIEDWMVPVDRLRAAETADLEGTLLAVGRILVHNLLSPAGLRLLRITNAESGRMPEIGAYTVHRGTDRTIAYLADVFRRHLSDPDGGCPDAADAAEAFLHLVVGGPANAAAWGVRQEREAIDRRIDFSVRLLLHGLGSSAVGVEHPDVREAVADERRRVREVLEGALAEIDDASGRRCVKRGGSVGGLRRR